MHCRKEKCNSAVGETEAQASWLALEALGEEINVPYMYPITPVKGQIPFMAALPAPSA